MALIKFVVLLSSIIWKRSVTPDLSHPHLLPCRGEEGEDRDLYGQRGFPDHAAVLGLSCQLCLPALMSFNGKWESQAQQRRRLPHLVTYS